MKDKKEREKERDRVKKGEKEKYRERNSKGERKKSKGEKGKDRERGSSDTQRFRQHIIRECERIFPCLKLR